MKLIPLAMFAAIATLSAAPAFASDESASCGNAPKSDWMTEDAIKAKATEAGYEVRQVKVEDGCYEVYGIDAKGAKAEVLMNPVTGETVEVKTKD
ncbi:MAG: PepSY domain-containing protein [Notoacmeibacter sp.]|nr:PepSY domain-containing protein [Notoacmeibacter sp.]MCC0032204.1 PepSY domain-containing protein [Brucellaceae bacterium]